MSEEKKCETGCQHFCGGEIKHHKDCVFYPESLSEMYDKQQEIMSEITPIDIKIRHISVTVSVNYEQEEVAYNLINELLELIEAKHKEELNGWISVKDSLPEEYGQYLIYCPQTFPKNCRFLSANYYDDNKKFYCDAHESVHDDVTHWRKIEEPQN